MAPVIELVKLFDPVEAELTEEMVMPIPVAMVLEDAEVWNFDWSPISEIPTVAVVVVPFIDISF